MNKFFYLITILTIIGLTGCQTSRTLTENNIETSGTDQAVPVQETNIETSTNLEDTAPKELKYKLIQDESFSPAYLTLNSDGTFSMDFNSCHSMIATTGVYTQKNDNYILNVLECESCNKEAQGIAGVKIDLLKNSNNELVIQNPVIRNYPNSKEEVRFCAPDKSEGINTYKLVE